MTAAMERRTENAGYRHARLEGLILEELRSLVSDDVSDPALADARISAVALSVDYRSAKVHFVLQALAEDPEPDHRRAERAFVRATAFLRARLAGTIDLKRVPDLRFVFDGVTKVSEPEG